MGDDQGRQFGKQRNLLNFQNFAWLRVNKFPKFVSAFVKIAKFVYLIVTLFQKLFYIWEKASTFNEIIILAYDNSATVLNNRTCIYLSKRGSYITCIKTPWKEEFKNF